MSQPLLLALSFPLGLLAICGGLALMRGLEGFYRWLIRGRARP